jgi:transposase InsO family protein
MQNGYVESFKIREELLNENLSFGIGHARSAVAEWVADHNTARPHSSLGCDTGSLRQDHHRNPRLRA